MSFPCIFPPDVLSLSHGGQESGEVMWRSQQIVSQAGVWGGSHPQYGRPCVPCTTSPILWCPCPTEPHIPYRRRVPSQPCTALQNCCLPAAGENSDDMCPDLVNYLVILYFSAQLICKTFLVKPLHWSDSATICALNTFCIAHAQNTWFSRCEICCGAKIVILEVCVALTLQHNICQRNCYDCHFSTSTFLCLSTEKLWWSWWRLQTWWVADQTGTICSVCYFPQWQTEESRSNNNAWVSV